eukprot:2264200-Prymnesium_polylepis.1
MGAPSPRFPSSPSIPRAQGDGPNPGAPPTKHGPEGRARRSVRRSKHAQGWPRRRTQGIGHLSSLSGRWPMVAPGGGVGRYAALRCLWYEVRVDERTVR